MYNLNEILSRFDIVGLNDMQQSTIDAATQHNNILLLSDTGSGKTLAFLLAMLENIKPGTIGTQALVIAPSRELALQIEHVFKKMSTGYKVTACYGGHLRETEENNLLEAPTLIIGTPGRLADHIRRENIKTETIKLLILDEFDKSLELGFEDEMSFIISQLINLEKRMLISATEAVEVPSFISMQNAHRIDFLSNKKLEALEVRFVRGDGKDKTETLFRLICSLGNRMTIVFCNHRDTVNRISEHLSGYGIVNEFYHGALEQQERDAALFKFRNGTTNILITTDLASRGLDIPHIRYIIHYHLPPTEEIFTHRNGRTARMHASGTAILLLSPDEFLPPFASEAEEIILPETNELPEKPKWSTLFFAAGKKDKINKVDIVGFLSNKGGLKKEDIGLIEVKDFHAFAAVRKQKAGQVLELIKKEKIKNKKVRIEIAK